MTYDFSISPRVLALDIATVTGWAHSCGTSGVWDFRLARDDSRGMRIIRLISRVQEVVSGPGVDLIAFESVTAGRGKNANFNSVIIASEMVGALKSFCEARGIEYAGYNISEIKSHAIKGKGKRDKDAMISAARKKWPDTEIVDDNHADALWILDLCSERLKS